MPLPQEEFEKRFFAFLMNDWVHMERRVASLDAKVTLMLSILSVLIGLVIYGLVSST
jgi:hypothetical protein